MKYTYTICLLILFCGMKCNNPTREHETPVAYSLDQYAVEKGRVEASLMELEYRNLILERLSKVRKTLQIENPNMGNTIIFTNDSTLQK